MPNVGPSGLASASNLSDSELKIEREWSFVLSRWLDGDAEPMAAWLRDSAAVLPEDARQFLADQLRGKVVRPRGRRPRRSGQEERAIACDYFREYEAQALRPQTANPQDRAYSVVASRHATSPPTVRGIVERLAKAGITLEAWKRWGRPDWTT